MLTGKHHVALVKGDVEGAEDVLVRVHSEADLSVVERDMIAQVLADCAGNKSKAAARLGISRTQLYVRLRRYQLS